MSKEVKLNCKQEYEKKIESYEQVENTAGIKTDEKNIHISKCSIASYFYNNSNLLWTFINTYYASNMALYKSFLEVFFSNNMVFNIQNYTTIFEKFSNMASNPNASINAKKYKDRYGNMMEMYNSLDSDEKVVIDKEKFQSIIQSHNFTELIYYLSEENPVNKNQMEYVVSWRQYLSIMFKMFCFVFIVNACMETPEKAIDLNEFVRNQVIKENRLGLIDALQTVVKLNNIPDEVHDIIESNSHLYLCFLILNDVFYKRRIPALTQIGVAVTEDCFLFKPLFQRVIINESKYGREWGLMSNEKGERCIILKEVELFLFFSDFYKSSNSVHAINQGICI